MTTFAGLPRQWLLLAVVLCAAVPYLPTVTDYFTQDDFGVIQLMSDRPWSMFPKWFTIPWTENIWAYTPDEIRPFVALSYQVSAIPGRARPELHHLLNIAIHAANALLVMGIARRAAGLTLPAAAFAGVIFGLLPVQAESVAWITGRVDSMPAFFYFATFLAYVQWRQSRERAAVWYGTALVLFFVALFSKQNTITMVVTLAVYDLVVLRTADRGTLLACIRAWLPFALMTVGYLGLRRALFGSSLRSGIGTTDKIVESLEMIGRHLLRTVLGHADAVARWEMLAGVAIGVVCLVWLARNRSFVRPALGLGVAWWIVGAAPVLAAGYESPRHVYLASAGWALLLGMIFEASVSHASQRSNRWLRAAPVAVAAMVAGVYLVRLHATVNSWNEWAAISQAAVARIAEEAAAAPEGTLLLVSVPQKSWEWSAPFVLQPPYTSSDLSRRVHLVTPFRLHCCGPTHWDPYTREKLHAWRKTPGRPPVIALDFAPRTGAVSRLTDAERPELRTILDVILETDSWMTMNTSIVNVLERMVRK